MVTRRSNVHRGIVLSLLYFFVLKDQLAPVRLPPSTPSCPSLLQL
jgi:hypothetical protein